jgi:6-phosphogluconolactonase
MTQREDPTATTTAGTSVLYWVGTYTSDAGALGRGVETLVAGSDVEFSPGGVAAVADSPSFLAVHPLLPVVYAVNEFAQTVSAYARDGATALTPLGEQWPTGDAGCHVSVDPEGRFIVVACWGDGSVLLFDLDAQGRIVSRTEAPRATDPHASAGVRPSRAHASLMLGDDRILTTDLGFDLVRVWRYEPAVGLIEEQTVVLPEGSGPRHLALHPNGRVYVDTEYSIEVVTVESVAGTYQATGRVPATHAPALPGDAASEIGLSADGRFAYVGVRGSNRIGTLSIEDDGAVAAVADTDCGGDWPRHLTVRKDTLLVANEHSGNVAVFRLDEETGIPADLLQDIEIGAPTALIAAQRA